jgi:ABC-type uncharacterized transport system ATPase subunit
LFLLLAGCARDVSAPESATVPGVYHLTTVNGVALPYLVQQNVASRVDVTESVLTLNADLTWSEVTAYRVSGGSGTSTDTQMTIGTWAAMNGAVALTSADGFTSSGAVSRTLLTLIGQGFTMVYRR